MVLHCIFVRAKANNMNTSTNTEKDYDKEFSRKMKAYHPCTYKQIEYAHSLASKTDSEIAPNNSQLLKYFEMADMSEAIDLMKEGKRIRIS